MRAQEFLKELFQPGKDWQWSFNGSEEAVAEFQVGDVPYQFHAYTAASEDPGVWEVEFKNASQGPSKHSSKFGLTGTGNSAEVMSTVADIMREFLQRYLGSISQLSFTADEPSRQALYARMARRLLPNWEVVQSGKNFTLLAPETVTENWGVSKEPIPLPIGDYLADGSDEFAPPGNYRSAEDLHDEVYDLIDAGVEPQVVNIDPRTVLATQDWLSNAGGDDPLFDEYPDRPVIYSKSGKLYILDGHHRTTRAWKAGRPISVYLFSDQQQDLDEDIYDVLQPLDCGPFDGGCVLVAQALQQIHGGRVVVLVDADDRAQHAAVLADGKLIDYDGAADPKEFVQQFEQNERVRIQGIRAIRDHDLPDAPRDVELIPQIVQALSENFADGKNPGRKGLSKRVGIPKKASLSQLQKIASSSTGERRRMAQWQLNMRRGRAKKNK